MKHLCTLLICTYITSTALISQSATNFLKFLPAINTDTPEWAIEMYKDNPDVLKVDALYKEFYKNEIFQKSVHTQNYKHWRPQVEQYLNKSGQLSLPTADESEKQWTAIKKKRSLSRNNPSPWRPLGPMQTLNDTATEMVSWQANVYTIDQSISNPNVVYVGTENGGIFKSEDKGQNWFMVSQETNMRTITAIKVSPWDADLAFAGTGTEIYKTEDGGITWQLVFNRTDLSVTDFAFVSENQILASSRLGLWISEDNGDQWRTALDQTVWDIEQKPESPEVVYLLRSNPTLKRSEVWKSIDGGQNFVLADNGWYNSSDAARSNGGGRMAVSAADPERLYVILIGQSQEGDQGYIGIYRSEDSAGSWTLADPPIGGPYTDDNPNLATLNNTNFLHQGYYNLGLAVSPFDADHLLIGALNLWESRDGASTFTPLGGYRGGLSWIHPDQQEIEINGTDAWVVNDGGINYSTDMFATHTSRINGLNATEFWGFGSGWNEDLLVGGRYHNGNSAHRPAFGEGIHLRLGGAEAATGYVQPGGDMASFFSDISGKIIPQNLGEAVINTANPSLFPNESFFSANWSEMEFAPECYGHIYVGRDNKLYKSVDNGNYFNLLAEFGEVDDPVHNFEISRVDRDVLYVYQRTTFFGAVLHVSRDGGMSWETKDFPTADSQRSGALAIHSDRPETLWVSFAHNVNDGNKIFRSDDYGSTWTNITEELLDGETAICLFHQAGTENLFLGTNYGIYQHNGISWTDCSAGLPARTYCNRFRPFYKENKLRVATYGNGLWEMDLSDHTAPRAQPTVDKTFSDCSRDTFYFDDYSILEHDNATFSWEFTPEPVFISDATIRNPKVVFGNAGTYSVRYTVTNVHGTDTKEEINLIDVNSSGCSPTPIAGMLLEVNGNGEDYVQTTSLGLTTEAYTITAWVKRNGNQNDFSGIFFNDDDSYGLNVSSGNQLGFHHGEAGSAAWAWQTNLVLPDEEWSYVALTVEPNRVTMYMDDQQATRDLTLEPATFGTMKIGSYRGWSSRNFNGHIDEVTLWNRALTDEEIRLQRHLTKTKTADGLVAYYQFNSTGSIAYDAIGLAHGNLRGTSQLDASSAPVGSGSSSIWKNGQGDGSFLNEEAILTGERDGELVISQLDVNPFAINLEIFPANTYWIINAYNQEENLQLSLLNGQISPLAGPSSVLLYGRDENGDQDDWLEIGRGMASTETTGKVAIDFEINDSVMDKQIVMTFDGPVYTKEDLEPKPKIYPNPAVNDILVEGIEKGSEIALYNLKGEQIWKGILNGGQVELPQGLPSGSYIYWIIESDKMSNGQVIIEQN